jgi:hypothetical protein
MGAAMTAEKPSYLPEFGLDDCLWLVTVRGQWPVYAHTSGTHAMHQARDLMDDAKGNGGLTSGDVRVTKVFIADYQPLEYRRETVLESLVPKDQP